MSLHHSVGFLQTHIGVLAVEVKGDSLVKVQLVSFPLETHSPSFALALCLAQLEEYFSGERESFDLPITLEGTDFQKKVWEATDKIPHGEVLTYAQIAEKIGHPKAVRAVGTALGFNPVPVVIPCHRVLPSSGGVGNYAWGSNIKESLLRHENYRVVS